METKYTYTNYMIQNQDGMFLSVAGIMTLMTLVDNYSDDKYTNEPQFGWPFDNIKSAQDTADKINKIYDDSGVQKHVHIVKINSTFTLEEIIK